MYLTLRIGGTPLYAITDWTLTKSPERDDVRLVYRPSWRTIVRRILVSAICLVLLVVMVTTFGLPGGSGLVASDPVRERVAERRRQEAAAAAEQALQDLRRTLPADQWEEVEQKVQQRQTERQKQQEAIDRRDGFLSGVGQCLYWTTFALLAAVALLAPAPWQRVAVEGNPRQGLRVTMTLFRSHTRECPPGSVAAITIVAYEWWHKGRFAPTFLGWRWAVRITRFDPTAGQPMMLEFWLDLDKVLPRHLEDLTPRVRLFVAALERFTGLQATPPAIQLSHLRQRFGHRMPPPALGE